MIPMNPIKRFFLSLCAAALMTNAALAADGFSTLSFPLAVTVEGESVPTAIHLQFAIKRYDVPFDTFAARELDPREAKFAAWMKAVRSRDVAKVESMFAAPRATLAPVDQSAERSRVVAKDRSPKQVVELYHAGFDGLRDVTVIGQVLAGSKSLFLWEAKGGEGRVRRAFSIDSSLKVSEVTMSTPVELLIVNNIVDRGGVPGHKTPYEFAFPIDGAWTPGPHPVVIQFTGKPVDIPFYDDAPAADPVVALYRNAYGELKQRNVEKFLTHFTAKSRTKWQRWYEKLPAEGFAQYHANATAPRAIKFILDASPILIVFHGDAGNWTAGSLRYDYIVKSASNGELKFANVAFSGFFDDVLGSPSLFDQNVLRPAQTMGNGGTNAK